MKRRCSVLRRSLLLLLALAALWWPGPGWSGEGPVELEYWHILGGDLGRAHEELVEEFNSSRTDIRVRYSYSGDSWTGWDKLVLAIAAGTAPDLALIEDYWTAKLASSGALLELDGLIAGEGRALEDDIYPLFWRSWSYAGTVWAMPYAMSNLMMYYNKDLFREAGLDPEAPPRTWDELVSVGLALTRDLDGDGRTDQWALSFPLTAQTGVVYYWLPFLWQKGGELLNPDGTGLLFAATEGVEALQFWVDLIHGYGIVPLAPPIEGFLAGRVAMTLGSSAKLGYYLAQAGFELGVAPLPMNAERATILGGKGLAVFTQDERKQQAAWEFIRWLTAAEQNLRWSITTGYSPIRLSVLRSRPFQEYLERTPGAETSLEELLYTRPRPALPGYTEISRIIGLALEKALFGREDPQKVLEEAAEEAEQYL
ncbi:MAG: ABC transporter substrate-binding protein [Candidatus Acetothermia bacterium]|jgi:ABC-type glycerol-3-phosphate transport system substrate-binding protein|nr:ABC transporter substrate-binding protein [Candidatus Acetothermia bacterium]MDH7504619.1 ABC transporter substrate-binding protein [Candidatus Acetothermia bacterium]